MDIRRPPDEDTVVLEPDRHTGNKTEAELPITADRPQQPLPPIGPDQLREPPMDF